jgi:hypothetical protein
MRILTFESPDKKQQVIEEIAYDDLLLKLKEDHGLVEVIEAYDQNVKVRVYFDLDSTIEIPLTQVLDELTSIFNSSWAISDGCREGKYSYHIVSKDLCISLKNLRTITNKLTAKFPCVDYTLLCLSIPVTTELLFYRFPNQSKRTINKSGPPMRIIEGELKDFIVTWIEGLREFV